MVHDVEPEAKPPSGSPHAVVAPVDRAAGQEHAVYGVGAANIFQAKMRGTIPSFAMPYMIRDMVIRATRQVFDIAMHATIAKSRPGKAGKPCRTASSSATSESASRPVGTTIEAMKAMIR